MNVRLILLNIILYYLDEDAIKYRNNDDEIDLGGQYDFCSLLHNKCCYYYSIYYNKRHFLNFGSVESTEDDSKSMELDELPQITSKFDDTFHENGYIHHILYHYNFKEVWIMLMILKRAALFWIYYTLFGEMVIIF